MKKWFKSKFNEIGEKAVDSMVNLILSKNSTPINLSNQNPLINAITKSVNSKFTVKQPNTKLLDANLERYPPICDFNLFVSEGIFLLVSDGSMAHTKYFSNVNKNSSSSNTNQSNAVSSLSTGSDQDQSSKLGINSIRHTMIVDEKKNKIEFDTVGSVKPNFCKYKLEVEMNNKSYSSERKNMYEDFNRVIFDYSFTGKVYNINTDVIISLWCQLDLNKYTEAPIDEPTLKKPLQPRKISSVQCPSIYAPKLSMNSSRFANGGSISDEYSVAGESTISQSSCSNTLDEHSMLNGKNLPSNGYDSDLNKKDKNLRDSRKDKYNYMENLDLDDLLSVGEEDPQEENKEGNFSRKIGRAVLSIPLLLSSFKPEGSLDIHEDLKFLLKYSKQVLSVNMKNYGKFGSSSKHKAEKDGSYESFDAESKKNLWESDVGRRRYTIRSCFWVQLLPFNENDDFKFVRPYCGYPCYGMRNPVDSIGFLLVTVELAFGVNPTLLPIVNNLVPQSHCWAVAKNFEIFHISQVADRFIVYFTNIPIWVTRLLFGGTHYIYNHNYIDNYIEKKLRKARSQKNESQSKKKGRKNSSPEKQRDLSSDSDEDVAKDEKTYSSGGENKMYYVETCQLDGVDLLFILPFWFLIFELVVHSSLWKVPIILFLMILLIVLYYQVVMNRFTCFGDRISSMKSLHSSGLLGDYVGVGRIKYKSCGLFSSDNSVLHNLDKLVSGSYSTSSSTPVSSRRSSSRYSVSGSVRSNGSNTPSRSPDRDKELMEGLSDAEKEKLYGSASDNLKEGSTILDAGVTTQDLNSSLTEHLKPDSRRESHNSVSSRNSNSKYKNHPSDSASKNLSGSVAKTLNKLASEVVVDEIEKVLNNEAVGSTDLSNISSDVVNEQSLASERENEEDDSKVSGTTTDSGEHREAKNDDLNEKMAEMGELKRNRCEKRRLKREKLEKERLDKFNNSLIENHLYRKFKLINRFGVVANDSVVVTPFGNYKLNFLGLGEEYPIFSEDLGDFDIRELVKGVLVSLKYIQQILGYVCTFSEKIRFSLDTGYYPTTVLTLFLLLVTLVPLSLFLKFLSRVSVRTARFALFLYILTSCMKPHLRVMASDFKLFLGKVFKVDFNSESSNFILFSLISRWFKKRLSLVAAFYKNWLLGLPDHREVDHRKICVLQNLPSLCQLLPKEYEVDWRYFKRQFKNHYKLLGSNLKDSESDLNTYAKCKSLIERTVLDEYLSSSIPRDLSAD